MVAQAVHEESAELRVVTEARGAVARLWGNPCGEVVISGPAGTGKTYGILEWIHHRCATERLRVLFLRKTLESLKGSVLVTYQEQVLIDFDGHLSLPDGVSYFGGNKIRPAAFTYHEIGSVITLAGMDNIAKVLSTEFDIIYINETTELNLAEWEQLTGRTDRPRLGKARPPSLVLGDCNPDVPTHWIQQRAKDGALTLWESRHEDNPAMWDRDAQTWTAAGLRYLARLDKLTGVRYQRLRRGKWVAAEGQIYELFDPAIHLVQRFEIPRDWPRYWVVDFGYVHPFVLQWWAQGPDGDLFRYREIYMTRRLVTDHVATAMRAAGCTQEGTGDRAKWVWGEKSEPKPAAVITDHDAEDRATFEQASGLTTIAAKKEVTSGIERVALRLRPDDDRPPRLRFLRDSVVERDESLAEQGKPCSTEEEFPGYIWDTSQGRKKGEQPVKENDHGCDATRYLVMHVDAWDATPMPVLAFGSAKRRMPT